MLERITKTECPGAGHRTSLTTLPMRLHRVARAPESRHRVSPATDYSLQQPKHAQSSRSADPFPANLSTILLCLIPRRGAGRQKQPATPPAPAPPAECPQPAQLCPALLTPTATRKWTHESVTAVDALRGTHLLNGGTGRRGIPVKHRQELRHSCEGSSLSVSSLMTLSKSLGNSTPKVTYEQLSTFLKVNAEIGNGFLGFGRTVARPGAATPAGPARRRGQLAHSLQYRGSQSQSSF
jgi:hypothetical protein